MRKRLLLAALVVITIVGTAVFTQTNLQGLSHDSPQIISNPALAGEQHAVTTTTVPSVWPRECLTPLDIHTSFGFRFVEPTGHGIGKFDTYHRCDYLGNAVDSDPLGKTDLSLYVAPINQSFEDTWGKLQQGITDCTPDNPCRTGFGDDGAMEETYLLIDDYVVIHTFTHIDMGGQKYYETWVYTRFEEHFCLAHLKFYDYYDPYRPTLAAVATAAKSVFCLTR